MGILNNYSAVYITAVIDVENIMLNRLKKYVGNNYVFRLDGILMSGHFCGIGKLENKYGMVFVGTKVANVESTENIAIFISPSRIKCTLYSNMIDLRRSCRKIFRRHKLNAIDREEIYYPLFQIEEVSHERGLETRR